MSFKLAIFRQKYSWPVDLNFTVYVFFIQCALIAVLLLCTVLSAVLIVFFVWYCRDPQIFQVSGSRFQSLGAGRVTRSKFRTGDP